ncbi:MAG: D-glycero-beta-D-manno-heptose-7-phosphate kinase [Campylobacter sp.]|nr:D-glycero-beta-D-manno-heptose-7-phosphate kinase [Campylobacter sp.]
MYKILVIGDLMIDHYLWGECDRISPEAPVQIVDIKREDKRLGGAGNVIANLKALGARVGVLSVVGDDDVADEILSLLDGVDAQFLVKEKGRKTSQKSRLMAVSQQIVRFDKESKDSISKESEDSIILKFKQIIKEYDGVLLSDYAKGVLTPTLCQNVIEVSRQRSKFVLVDPKGKDYSKYRGATLLTPNRKEATLATGIEIVDENTLKKAIIKLKDELNLSYSLITLSDKGIALYDKSLDIIPAIAREVYDVTGAGDTVLATLGYAFSAGMNALEATMLANRAAAVVIGKVGSATATLGEISEYEKLINSYDIAHKIKSIDELSEILTASKEQVIFTNGCFDILHAGHVSYLSRAKALGGMLVLGLNSDDSVKRLKGKDRPINNQKARATVLAGLASVDYVVIFDEDTPYELIKAIKPDLLVKGADYADKEVVGSDIASKVVLIEFEDGFSTTNIINKIKG